MPEAPGIIDEAIVNELNSSFGIPTKTRLVSVIPIDTEPAIFGRSWLLKQQLVVCPQSLQISALALAMTICFPA